MGRLMMKWEKGEKGQRGNGMRKINEMEERVEEAWMTYQDLTGRLDKIVATINRNQGKMAIFAAASMVLGRNYFGRRASEFIVQS